jgi:hypothetical protein
MRLGCKKEEKKKRERGREKEERGEEIRGREGWVGQRWADKCESFFFFLGIFIAICCIKLLVYFSLLGGVFFWTCLFDIHWESRC